jgi:carbamoyl-phosphate synthase large subunit
MADGPTSSRSRPRSSSDHRRRSARRAAADARRPDGAQLRDALHEPGVLEKYGVELIGAKPRPSRRPRTASCSARRWPKIGLDVPRSRLAHTMDEARARSLERDRPAASSARLHAGRLGRRHRLQPRGVRGDRSKWARALARTTRSSSRSRSRLEGVRARGHARPPDNVVIICSIENLDPMGVHTGDSITVAPAQTLTDREYQRMRDAAIAVIREIGVETGGSNVQFASTRHGRMIVIEMNPRVSRSSALASKATGLPDREDRREARRRLHARRDPKRHHARHAGVLRADHRLRRHQDPALHLREVPRRRPVLTTQMKSVGEVMAIGRTFKESLQKALRGSRRAPASTPRPARRPPTPTRRERSHAHLAPRARPIASGRRDALRRGMTVEEIHERRRSTRGSSPAVARDRRHEARGARGPTRSTPRPARRQARSGFSDRRIAALRSASDREAGARLRPSSSASARSTSASTPARPSSRRTRPTSTRPTRRSARPPDRPPKKVMILGGGPNRIGQGIEFDYCCVPRRLRAARAGFETIMVNCNPETVSTDYDTSDRLYFEPLTLEDVLRSSTSRRSPRGDRAVRRPDAAQARPRARGRGRADPRHLARRDRPRRGPRALRRAARPSSACASRRTARDAREARPPRSPSASATRCSCARATCSAAAPWRSSTTRRRLARYMRDAVRLAGPTTRCSSTSSSRTRSRSTSTRRDGERW